VFCFCLCTFVFSVVIRIDVIQSDDEKIALIEQCDWFYQGNLTITLLFPFNSHVLNFSIKF
jgi:hypothetical protein